LITGIAARTSPTVAAKIITEKFYGERPHEAYFNGCSNGGRQALMEVQRYPGDFNGIIAGDPSFLLDGQLNRIWGYQTLFSDADHYIPASKLPLIASAITAECDGKDGLMDGLIDDPRNCGFDAATLLCTKGDAATCLTAGQVDSFEKITAGPTDAHGKQIARGFTLGGEDGPGGWNQWVVGTSATQPDGEGFAYMKDFLRYLAFPDHQNPNYDYRTFNFATDMPLLAQATEILKPDDPNLAPFAAMGGKLLMYHGWADPALSTLTTIDYYNEVVDASGGHQTADSFVRFFHRAGDASLLGRAGTEHVRCAHGARAMGRTRRRARSDHRHASHERRGGSHAAAVPVSASGALPRHGQHRRRGEFRVQDAGAIQNRAVDLLAAIGAARPAKGHQLRFATRLRAPFSCRGACCSVVGRTGSGNRSAA
jgi:hypothetical protein